MYKNLPVYNVARQKGVTLLELMIAIAIALFMIGAILTVEQSNHTAFVNQNQLAQVQDGERMALSIISDVVQSAGYFPNPSSYSASGTLTAIAPFAAGQSISGTYSATAPGDSITVRFATANNDGILNCSGTSNISGANQLYTSTFSVINGQLVCSMSVNNGVVTPYTLVGDNQKIVVNNFSVQYGVNTTGSGTGIDTYMNAAQVTAADDWNNVNSVIVSLTFNNPLYVVGTKQPQTISILRVIGVMKSLGPKI